MQASRLRQLAVLVLLGLAWVLPATASPIETDLFIQSTCEIPGTVVEIAIRVDATDGTLVAGQFSLSYDPAAFHCLGCDAGSTCDPTSPFSTVIFESVDEANGSIFAAVGLELGDDPHPLNGPVTVACLRLLPLEMSTTDVCMTADAHPRSTKFIDGDGALLSLPGLVEPAPGEPPTEVSCVAVLVDDKCACTPGGNECAALNTACSLGLCDEDKGVCAVLAVNKGGPCDDGNTCTTRDVCEETHCVGHDCSQPSICLLHHECGRPGALMHVAVRLGESDVAIAGGQFTIQYDPEGMELVSISPGNECSPSSPFTVEVGSVINESSGDIFYGVGIGFDQLPTTGPAILACLTFNVLDRARSEVCTFVDVNPFNTYLVDEHGQIVQSFNGDDCPTDRPFPLTSCIEYMFCPIPTASAWGLLVLALSLATLAKIAAMRRRAA